jgi:hypothetical protein
MVSESALYLLVRRVVTAVVGNTREDMMACRESSRTPRQFGNAVII